MEHLNTEILARLVDQTPQPEEAAHIAECEACSAELEAIRSQTDALRSLPEIRAPQGDWHGAAGNNLFRACQVVGSCYVPRPDL